MSVAVAMSNFDNPLDHDTLLASSTRPHSIDLTLELERQLECESMPNSPAPNARPQSLDTHVLASIVTQLRMSLEDMTKERDALSVQLSETKYREENLKEALHTITEKCLRAEGHLVNALDQHKEDEEAISMLRQKVEESRRALMRLQTESRRVSQVSNLTLDLSRAGATMGNGPASSKRASFTPLTGSPAGRSSHRRIASLSDPGLMSAPTLGESSQWPLSPDFEGDLSAPLNRHSRRMSGLFGLGSPPLPERPSFDAMEMEVLRKDLAAIKEQLEETRHELSEAHEAKEASEMCVRALRTFIAENGVGEQTSRIDLRAAMKSPPVSASSPAGGSASRWGFKLWSTPDTPANTPLPITSPLSAGAAAPSPVSRKLGGLFSPRSSISSISAPRPNPVSLPRESSYLGSDTSSIADSATEPVSPASSIPRATVLVHDSEGSRFEAMVPAENTTSLKFPA
ncbi:uncharacterized protein FIBRA_02408 [Fibroporia radiculosa]|uniref:Uncharacterized protein n=1 Tax=Fibroporia radiculosa TaxID=599839 RepID=J4G1N8_9APHY|nr:uncharacterized protein FIBRA_02408 [Fibroporia radiculosa]CCM00378.1 predicted protein [Fibroporia radiculosa]